jgi:hypothetical protein
MVHATPRQDRGTPRDILLLLLLLRRRQYALHAHRPCCCSYPLLPLCTCVQRCLLLLLLLQELQVGRACV